MNRTQQEIILHGVRWARNILVEVAGNHTRGLGKESSRLLKEAISNLTDFDHAMGTEHPEEPLQPKAKALQTYIMESKDKSGNDFQVLVTAEGRDKANDIFEKEFGGVLDEPGAWASTRVALKPGILKL